MTFANNNKAIIERLAKRSIHANKLRNIFAIVAIALTSLLFTSLFTVGIGMVNTFQQQTMRQSGGYAHGTFKYIDLEKYNKIKNHPLIKDSGYSIHVGSAENVELLKHHTEIRYATDKQAEMFFSKPTTGRMPQNINECATDTAVLDLLKIPHELGQKVKVFYSIDEKEYMKELTLCGFWETDDVMPASMVWVSQAFIDKNLDMTKKLSNDYPSAGSIDAEVMFGNSFNIGEKVQTVLKDCGYSSDETAPNYVATGINWAYMSTNFDFDPLTIAIVVTVLLLIIFTGYLIIFNIFQISIVNDIHFYGLLKTIGTTQKQIKKFVKKQAIMLATIGIPIGLVFGFLAGSILLPIIMNTMSTTTSYLSANPIIFIGAATFSAGTVLMSCKKPAKIAASVSPIEALRYTDSGKKGKKLKKFTNGGRIHKMAYANIMRNKKKTILVVISMSLSLILLNSIYTVSNGFDINKYLSNFLKTDYIAANANYFSVIKQFRTKDDVISEQMIDSVNDVDGIEDAGRIYYDLSTAKVPATDKIKKAYCDIPKWTKAAVDNMKEVNPQLYGLDDFPATVINVVEGKFDLGKFKTGNYIIEGVPCADNGAFVSENSFYKIGEKVPLKFKDGTTKEYEVMAKISLDTTTDVRYLFETNPSLYLPSSEFTAHIKNPATMSYLFNVTDKANLTVERFIKNYTEKIEPQMSYVSKMTYVNEFKQFQNTFLLVGGALSFIIGMIGVLNFVNAILTSIISRKREFAMLQSIGMTTKQLNQMLLLEGLFYTIATIILSIVIGGAFSLGIINPLTGMLWFSTYHFTITPLLIAAPVLLVVSIIIPYLSYRNTNKQTIVERLHQVE